MSAAYVPNFSNKPVDHGGYQAYLGTIISEYGFVNHDRLRCSSGNAAPRRSAA